MKRLPPLFLVGGLAVLLLGGFGLIAHEVMEGDTMNIDMAAQLPGKSEFPKETIPQ